MDCIIEKEFTSIRKRLLTFDIKEVSSKCLFTIDIQNKEPIQMIICDLTKFMDILNHIITYHEGAKMTNEQHIGKSETGSTRSATSEPMNDQEVFPEVKNEADNNSLLHEKLTEMKKKMQELRKEIYLVRSEKENLVEKITVLEQRAHPKKDSSSDEEFSIKCTNEVCSFKGVRNLAKQVKLYKEKESLFTKEIVQLKELIQSLEDANKKLLLSLESSKMEIGNNISAEQKHIEALTAELKIKGIEIDILKSNIEQRNVEIERIKQDFKNKSEECKINKMELERVNEELSDKSNQENNIKLLKEKNDEMSKIIEEQNFHSLNNEAEIKKQTAELQNIKLSLEQSESERNNLLVQSNELLSKIQNLERENQELMNEMSRLNNNNGIPFPKTPKPLI